MKILVQARHMEVTGSIRQFVESKVSKLERLYDNLQSIEVILDMEADKAVVEKLGEDRVLEWDEEKEFLNVPDPYFLYYLRWADW